MRLFFSKIFLSAIQLPTAQCLTTTTFKKTKSIPSYPTSSHFFPLFSNPSKSKIKYQITTKSYIQDESTAMPDINDRATQEEEFALALRTRDRERKLIRKIDKSIAEIDSGDYGFCETCGVEIGVRRLEARPTATQCIDCKTLSEIKEKQAWGHA